MSQMYKEEQLKARSTWDEIYTRAVGKQVVLFCGDRLTVEGKLLSGDTILEVEGYNGKIYVCQDNVKFLQISKEIDNGISREQEI